MHKKGHKMICQLFNFKNEILNEKKEEYGFYEIPAKYYERINETIISCITKTFGEFNKHSSPGYQKQWRMNTYEWLGRGTVIIPSLDYGFFHSVLMNKYNSRLMNARFNEAILFGNTPIYHNDHKLSFGDDDCTSFAVYSGFHESEKLRKALSNIEKDLEEICDVSIKDF